MGLHFAIQARAARDHRKRRAKSRLRRLRPIVPNAKAELAYKAALLSIVRKCRSLAERALNGAKASWPAPAQDGIVRARDAGLGDVISPIKRAAGKLGNLDKWAKRMVGLAVEANRDNVDRRLADEIRRTIGVDVLAIFRSDAGLLRAMTAATKENVALMKSIPEQYFGRVYSTITKGWVSGLRWESLVEQVQRDGDITENRAKLIARDQTSKMNAAFNRERQQQVGIERYEWSTSRDERVRESHAAMDGKTCEWANPPIVDGEPVHAGEGINCRCTALPIVDEAAVAEQVMVAEREERQAA